mgnify:CR=1 FL=1
MTIKEVSELYDISQDTLRYYERIGMIPPVTRTPSGIRDYQENDLAGWNSPSVCEAPDCPWKRSSNTFG